MDSERAANDAVQKMFEQQNISGKFQQTVERCESIWASIGLSEEKRAEERRRLEEFTFKRLAEFESAEKAYLDGLEERMTKALENIQIRQAALKDDQVTPYGGPLRELVVKVEAFSHELDQLFNERSEHVTEGLKTIQSLSEEMKLAIQNAFSEAGDDFSLDRMGVVDEEVARLKGEKDLRADRLAKLIAFISNKRTELGIKPDEKRHAVDDVILDSSSGHNFGLSDDAIMQVEKRKQDFEEMERERKEEISMFAKPIAALWDRLKVDNEHRRSFGKSVLGLTPEVVEKYKQELDNMLAMKKEHMKDLIQEVRDQVTEIAKEIRILPEQREDIENFRINDDQTDEEKLKAHEDILDFFRETKRKLDPILTMINLLDEREQQIKDFYADPEVQQKLENRNYSDFRFNRQLDKIEQMEKKKNPAFREKLRTRILEWERTEGKELILNGVRYLDTLPEPASKPARPGMTTPKPTRSEPPASIATPITNGKRPKNAAKAGTAKPTRRRPAIKQPQGPHTANKKTRPPTHMKRPAIITRDAPTPNGKSGPISRSQPLRKKKPVAAKSSQLPQRQNTAENVLQPVQPKQVAAEEPAPEPVVPDAVDDGETEMDAMSDAETEVSSGSCEDGEKQNDEVEANVLENELQKEDSVDDSNDKVNEDEDQVEVEMDNPASDSENNPARVNVAPSNDSVLTVCPPAAEAASKGNFLDAVEILTDHIAKAAEHSDQATALYYARGQMYRELGMLTEALADTDKALAYNETSYSSQSV